jgi:hypothetical protein
MTKEAGQKIALVLQNILDGYSMGKKYNYCLEYSVQGLMQDTKLNESEIDLILQHLQEKEIIEDFVDSGSDDVIKESTFKVYFAEDFKIKAGQYLHKLGADEYMKKTLTETDPVVPDIEVGKLISYTDGTISYGDSLLDLRGQLKVLCRLFMVNKAVLIQPDYIKRELIDADKRESTSDDTLSKYVSELHTILKEHYGKPVIFNEKKEGWRFDPDRDLDS